MKRAFTLIELLVVISIIALLSSVVLASLNTAREKGRLASAMQFDAIAKHAVGDRAVGEWTFDASVAPWKDTSGSNSDASASNGAAVLATSGYNGLGAVNFDGVDDYVAIGSISTFGLGSQFSACAWAKTPGLASGMTSNGVLSLGYGFVMFIANDGRFFSKVTDGGSNVNHGTTDSLNDNKWHNLCLTYDGTTRRMYTDGQIKSAIAVAWPSNYTAGGNVGLGMDANNPPVTRFFGLIDDVRIYSAAISSSMIEKLYAEGAKAHELAVE